MTQTTLDMQAPVVEQAAINALALPGRAAIALNSTKTEKDLIALAESTKDITAIIDLAGRTQVHGMYMTAQKARIAVEKTSKDARDDATKFSKAVIAEESRLKALIEPEETRLKVMRDEFDVKAKREEEERQAKTRARIASIKQRIDDVRNFRLAINGKTSTELAVMLEEVSVPPDYESFEEFRDEFKTVRDQTIEMIGSAQLAAFNAEQAQAKKDAEAEAMRIELAAMRAANAKLIAEKEARESAAKAIESARAIPVQTKVVAVPVVTGGYRLSAGEPTITRIAPVPAPIVEVARIFDEVESAAPAVEYPTAQDIINLIATHYELSQDDAQDLLCSLDFSELQQAA